MAAIAARNGADESGSGGGLGENGTSPRRRVNAVTPGALTDQPAKDVTG